MNARFSALEKGFRTKMESLKELIVSEKRPYKGRQCTKKSCLNLVVDRFANGRWKKQCPPCIVSANQARKKQRLVASSWLNVVSRQQNKHMASHCKLIDSCKTKDLLQYGQETVRFQSYNAETNTVSFTYDPCFCCLCTMGQTRHGVNRKGTSAADGLRFPRYGHLHYWDPSSPITRLFRTRSEKRLDLMVPVPLVYDSRGVFHY
jgi:hypothetical protein